MNSCYHMVLSHGCIAKLITPSSYSNWPGFLPVFSVFTATSSVRPTRLEQLLKYQLGILGQLYSVDMNKPLIILVRVVMARYFTLRLYFHLSL